MKLRSSPESSCVAVLSLKQYRVMVSLGVSDEERKTLQAVEIDLAVRFERPPIACKTDEIDDALCYTKLTDRIDQFCQGKSFHLIEHLAFLLYTQIQQLVTLNQALWVRVNKVNVPIPNLAGGASFSFGDPSVKGDA